MSSARTFSVVCWSIIQRIVNVNGRNIKVESYISYQCIITTGCTCYFDQMILFRSFLKLQFLGWVAYEDEVFLTSCAGT